MPLFKEVCTQSHTNGSRKFKEGEIVRTVSISEKDAAIMNGLDPESGQLFEYVPIEDEVKEEKAPKKIK